MKKFIAFSAFAVLGVVALSSCKKDYECKVGDTVVSECNDCKGTTKTAFDTSCSLVAGTVSEK